LFHVRYFGYSKATSCYLDCSLRRNEPLNLFARCFDGVLFAAVCAEALYISQLTWTWFCWMQ